jgi:succinate dehydrogenase/fumarate reductase flavoprotein subunit
VELLQDEHGRVGGALLLDIRRGTFILARSRAILLAMGGGPTMYKVMACSADKSADGIALAFRAGAPLKDMEMIQFHPTGLVVPNSLMTGALLEEGLRGAGGRLLNGLKQRFMDRYDPVRLERSTRDLVARSAFTEVLEGRGTSNGGVWIDVSHLGADFVEQHFRGMVKRCRDFGKDLAREPVEVGPTAHFMMGGVIIDPQCRTSLEGLFVAGEDAGGVHGANRLGGNGVADSTVFGGIAGEVMARWIEGKPHPRISSAKALEVSDHLGMPLSRRYGEDLYGLQTRLRGLMWDQVGLIREGEGLRSALNEIEAIADRAASVAIPGGREYNLAWQDWLNLRSQVTVARLIARSAIERGESRGSHYRKDFPEMDLSGLCNVTVRAKEDGLEVWTEPVRFTRAKPETGVPETLTVEVGD